MRKGFSVVFAFAISLAGVSAPNAAIHQDSAAAASPPSLPAKPQAAHPCRPSVLGVLASLGWAYATKRSLMLPSPSSPCVEAPQETPAPQETKPASSASPLANLPAGEAMRKARLLFIRPRSSWFNREKLERELLKRKEFGEMGLELTRSANLAELVLEITRKTFTTRFTCSIIEPTTERVLAGTTASSLGGEIEPHLADAIIKQFKAARDKSATEEKKP